MMLAGRFSVGVVSGPSDDDIVSEEDPLEYCRPGILDVDVDVKYSRRLMIFLLIRDYRR